MTEDDLKRWRERTWGKAVARVPERPHLTRSGGEPVAPLYTSLDGPDVDRVGLPGEHPFTRGVQPTMYRGSLWTMRQYAGFGTARQSNERYRYLLSQGTTGLSVAFDLPTPALRDELLRRAREGETLLLRLARRGYEPWLTRSLRHPHRVGAVAALASSKR